MSREAAGPAQARRAHDALTTVEAMERAGARHGVPPRWVAVLMATSGGLIWALQSFESGLWSLVSLALVVLMVFGCTPLTRRTGALGRFFWGDMGLVGWAYALSAAVWLIFGVWGENNGYPWLWALAGAALFVETLIYYEVVRRAWLSGRRTGRPGGRSE